MELIDFIKEYEPKFTKDSRGRTIFTVDTQHVTKDTLEEALEFCYHVIEDKPILQYSTMNELIKAYKDGTLEPPVGDRNILVYRQSDLGYKPHFITYDTLELSIKFQEEYERKILWGR